MSRTKRILTILLSGALLSLFLVNWTSYSGDINPAPVALVFMLLINLVTMFLGFTPYELIVFTLIMVPFLYSTLHFFSGLPSVTAYLLVLRCILALIFCRLIVSFFEPIQPKGARTTLRIATSLAVPILWSEFLLDQTILIAIALPAVSGLLLYYLRELKNRG